MEEYVTVDHPYRLGTVRPPERRRGAVPQSIAISAAAKLTLRSPVAKGYLKFNKKEYIERLRSEFKAVK